MGFLKGMVAGAGLHLTLDTLDKIHRFLDQQEKDREDARLQEAPEYLPEPNPIGVGYRYTINLSRLSIRPCPSGMNLEITLGIGNLFEEAKKVGVDINPVFPRTTSGSIVGTPKLLLYCMSVAAELIKAKQK